jgi:hypothetical protein
MKREICYTTAIQFRHERSIYIMYKHKTSFYRFRRYQLKAN